MSLKLISDIHCEWHKDRGTGFIRNLSTEDVDILVIAGDIGFCTETLPLFAARFPQVVFVLGNHDYYGTTPQQRHSALESLCKQYPNLHWLNDSAVTVNGQRFIGGTLWFTEDPLNVMYEKRFADFQGIQGLRSWVYKANAKTVKYLKANTMASDIVVTHHMPSEQSVSANHKGNEFNRFFVCNMEKLICTVNPIMWMHGHTHGSFDYTLEGSVTRVLCNPLGYPFELNPSFQAT